MYAHVPVSLKVAVAGITRPPFGHVGVGHACPRAAPISVCPRRPSGSFCPWCEAEAVAVGHKDSSLSEVWRSRVVSTHHERPCGVACRFQAFEHDVSASYSEHRRVLNNNPRRKALVDKALEFEPEAGPASVKSGSAPCCGDILTGESAGEEINVSDSPPAKSVNCECSNVVMDRCFRPVLAQNGLRIRLNFAECDRLETGPVRGQSEAADA